MLMISLPMITVALKCNYKFYYLYYLKIAMHGSGIIFVSMYDTKSQLISMITGKDVSYAGFYHETIINESKRTLVNLFNIYDGTRVKWIPLEYTLDSLIKNPATNKIILRPFSGDISKFQGLIVHSPRYRIESNPLEVYKKMMLESVNILYSGEFITTAYYIINKALCSLTDGQYSQDAMNKGIISSIYIGKAFTINRDIINEDVRNQAIVDINRQCDDDIVNIVSTFLQLTEENDTFRSKCKDISSKIRELSPKNSIDNKLGVPLMSTRSDSNLETVYGKDLIKLDNENISKKAPESIREIFLQLSNITRRDNKSCVVIDINKMVETFNDAYPDSKISPPDKGSQGAIISSGPSNKYTTMKIDNATYKLPLKGASFTAFNDIQLKELIIQLESMHKEDKCINNLKREAIIELSKRNKIKSAEKIIDPDDY